jgi:hypothetical protein
MRRLHHRGPTVLALAAALVAASCGTNEPSPSAATTSQPTTTPSAVASATTTAGGLPDLGLVNVTTDNAAARGATIDRSGGTLSATDANGITYGLTVPAGALAEPTDIALYPVSAVANLAADSTLTGGVQFVPDGLSFVVPAQLTIEMPAGLDAATQAGLAWSADGAEIHRYPLRADGGTLRLSIFHFSGVGIANPLALPIAPAGCATQSDMEQLIAADASAPTSAEWTLDLRACYTDLVAPALQAGTHALDDVGPLTLYSIWLSALTDSAPTSLDDSSFTLAPEVDEAAALAATFLRAWYDDWNANCRAAARPNPNLAIGYAELAMRDQDYAAAFSLATTANRLDLETALDDLCVQVVIDPSRDYSATSPGENGTVNVTAGFRIDNGPLRFDIPIRVTTTLTGAATPFADSDTLSDGTFTASLTWPAGVDPLKIDILATLTRDQDGQELLTNIARFDRITKGRPALIAFMGSQATGGIETPVVFLMDADGGNARGVLQGAVGVPAWSPDGQQLALQATDADGKAVIEIASNFLDSTASPETTLVPNTTGGLWPGWSPNGTRIVFVKAGEIWTVGVDGSDPTKLADGNFARWSPDGGRIAFVTSTGTNEFEIHSIGPEGKDEQTLLSDPKLGPQQLAWSPDGTKIAFSGWVAPDGRYDIFVMNFNGSGLVQLTHTTAGAGSSGPTWSPDGTQIAFWSDRESEGVNVWVMNADGSGAAPRTASGKARDPAWQP